MATYSDLLRDPRWQKKRLEILNRDDFYCGKCFDGETTLHVHHKHYQHGKKPWEYNSDFLITLCKTCHEAVKKEDKKYWPILTENIRKKFFGDNLRDIAVAFNAIQIFKTSGITSSSLAWFFSEYNGMEIIEDLYFSNLRKENEQREQKTNKCSTQGTTKKNISEDCNRDLKTENCNLKTENKKQKTVKAKKVSA